MNIKKLKCIAISDTHTKHHYYEIEECDILIHAGDISSTGKMHNIEDFVEWFSKQPAKHKILIAGNHDFNFENKSKKETLKLLKKYNIIYLENSFTVIEGIKIYGTPDQPYFYNWAFNKTSDELTESYSNIPSDTQILVTHCPPYGILDSVPGAGNVGSEELMKELEMNKNIKYNIFGHIHEGYGTEKIGDVTFINASLLDAKYRPVNEPITFEI